MNVFQFAFYPAILVFALWHAPQFLYIYGAILLVYFVASYMQKSSNNSLRTRVQMASWHEPSGPIIVNLPIDVTNTLKFIKSFP